MCVDVDFQFFDFLGLEGLGGVGMSVDVDGDGDGGGEF